MMAAISPKIILLITLINFGEIESKAQTVNDIDGNVYNYVTIGKQVWLVQNLKTTRYQNGDPIPRVMDTTWKSLTTGAFCDYTGAADTRDYGRLYNWYAVDNKRKLAPKGWHIPTDNEWKILIAYLGGEKFAGSKLKEKSQAHWQYANEDATNETAFTARGGGSHYYTKPFGTGTWGIRSFGFWWTSTGGNQSKSYYYTMNSTGGNVYGSTGIKTSGFSIRCIRD